MMAWSPFFVSSNSLVKFLVKILIQFDPERILMSDNWDEFKEGWACGTMKCDKCGKIFNDVRFRYSCHDKVEGEWPKCCNDLTKFCNDWKPE